MRVHAAGPGGRERSCGGGWRGNFPMSRRYAMIEKEDGVIGVACVAKFQFPNVQFKRPKNLIPQIADNATFGIRKNPSRKCCLIKLLHFILQLIIQWLKTTQEASSNHHQKHMQG